MIWHVGFVVPDVGEAMDQMTAALHLGWRPVRTVDVSLIDSDGRQHDLEVEVVFSLGSLPSIELIREIPRSPLARRGQSSFHHLGYWVDDHGAERQRLESHGFSCFASAVASSDRSPQAASSVLLHDGPFGIGLEPTNVNEDRPSMRDLFPPGSPFHGEPTFGPLQ